MSRFRLLLGVRDYSARVRALSPIGYWPQWEPSGSVITDLSGNGRHGVYTAVTLGQPGIGDTHTAASYNGTSSYGNVQGASLTSAFNGSEGAFSCFMKVSGSGVWTDGVGRRLMYFAVNNSNRYFFSKSGTFNNTISFSQDAGGVSGSVIAQGISSLDWIHVAATWSQSANRIRLYVDGVLISTAAFAAGTFTGTIATSLIGAMALTPTNVISGLLAHAAVWARELTAAEVAELAIR